MFWSTLLRNAIKNFDKVFISYSSINTGLRRTILKGKIYYTELLKFRELNGFNKYRNPEAFATLLNYRNGISTVKFSEPFCFTYGVYDYFEDLIQGVDARVLECEEVEDGFVVKYEIKV